MQTNAIECTDSDFKALWDECPTEKNTMKMYGKTVDLPRFQKLYGAATYSFSGITLKPDPVIPSLVERCLEVARNMFPPASQWNGALVNFYPDGQSYISQHSDDERDLLPTAPILSFSFGGVRTFTIQEKQPGTGNIKEIKLSTKHGSLIVMAGRFQTEFTHGVPKTTKAEGQVGPRINVTVRAFRDPIMDSKRMKIDS